MIKKILKKRGSYYSKKDPLENFKIPQGRKHKEGKLPKLTKADRDYIAGLDPDYVDPHKKTVSRVRKVMKKKRRINRYKVPLGTPLKPTNLKKGEKTIDQYMAGDNRDRAIGKGVLAIISATNKLNKSGKGEKRIKTFFSTRDKERTKRGMGKYPQVGAYDKYSSGVMVKEPDRIKFSSPSERSWNVISVKDIKRQNRSRRKQYMKKEKLAQQKVDDAWIDLNYKSKFGTYQIQNPGERPGYVRDYVKKGEREKKYWMQDLRSDQRNRVDQEEKIRAQLRKYSKERIRLKKAREESRLRFKKNVGKPLSVISGGKSQKNRAKVRNERLKRQAIGKGRGFMDNIKGLLQHRKYMKRQKKLNKDKSIKSTWM